MWPSPMTDGLLNEDPGRGHNLAQTIDNVHLQQTEVDYERGKISDWLESLDSSVVSPTTAAVELDRGQFYQQALRTHHQDELGAAKAQLSVEARPAFGIECHSRQGARIVNNATSDHPWNGHGSSRLPSAENEHASASGEDGQTVATAHNIPSPVPSLLQRYYDRRGDVWINLERLQHTEYCYADTLAERELLADRGDKLTITDQQCQREFVDRVRRIQSDLEKASRDVTSLQHECETAGINTKGTTWMPEEAKTPPDSPVSQGYASVLDGYIRRAGDAAIKDKLVRINLEDSHRRHETLVTEPRVLGRLADEEVSCLADNGAGCNIVSHSFIKRHNIIVIPDDARSEGTLGNGKVVKSLGNVRLPFRFADDSEVHQVDFKIMRHCVRDVILGSSFLRVTQTFTRFKHRVIKSLRRIKTFRVRFMGSTSRISGMLDGSPVFALPDTGSDVMLISESYALQRGLKIHRGEEYSMPLEFADGSLDRTCGIVKDARWAYGTDNGGSIECDFYVLKTLQCDVLLSYDFLDGTDAFEEHSELFVDNEGEDSWTLSTIKIARELDLGNSSTSQWLMRTFGRSRSSRQSGPPAAYETETATWERERRRLLRSMEANSHGVTKLPPVKQSEARVALETAKAAFAKHMASQPKPPDTGSPPETPQTHTGSQPSGGGGVP